jgi:CHAD domain-containing protein
MSYAIQPNETVEQAAKRIATEQVEKAVDELCDESIDRHEAVHQARKRFKKIRGAVRLFRGAMDEEYGSENQWFRDLGRELSRVRDAEARIEALDALGETFVDQVEEGAFESVREALVERRDEVAGEIVDLDARVAEVAEQLRSARERIRNWRLDAEGFEAVENGLTRTYRRGRKALAAAYEEPTDEAFHEWRKRAKYHWYHTRLLRHVWPPMMKVRRRCLKQLGSLLGDDHDLLLLRQTVTESPERYGDPRELQALLALAQRRQGELRAKAHPLGVHVYAEEDKCFGRRIEAHWRAWSEATSLTPLQAGPGTA